MARISSASLKSGSDRLIHWKSRTFPTASTVTTMLTMSKSEKVSEPRSTTSSSQASADMKMTKNSTTRLVVTMNWSELLLSGA